jgi:archaellum component FlaC
MSTNPSPKPDPAPQLVSGTPHPERNWSAIISGREPAFAWALATFLGGLSISAVPRDTVVRLLVPVGVMFIYVWFIYPRNLPAGLRAARIAQLADSAYFMGFLWTLWALIDSFVLKSATGAETAFRVFGYALVTTAAGMATRLYLLQFKYGAGDQEAEAEFTVEQKLQEFSTAMQGATRSVQSFQTLADGLNRDVDQLSKTLGSLSSEFSGTHQETTKAVKDNITSVVEDIRSALKAPVQEYGRAIRAFTANVDQQSQLFIEAFQKSAGTLNQAIKDASETAHTTLRATTERIASDHLDLAQRFSNQTARILEELHNLSARMASLDIPPDGLKKIVDSFNQLELALLAVAGLLRPDGQLRGNLVRFGDEVQLQTDTVAKALTDVSNRLNSIKVPPEVVIDISELTRATADLRTSVDVLLQKASDQRWQTAPQIASEAILKLTTSVDNLRQSVANADVSMKEAANNADGDRNRWSLRNPFKW